MRQEKEKNVWKCNFFLPRPTCTSCTASPSAGWAGRRTSQRCSEMSGQSWALEVSLNIFTKKKWFLGFFYQVNNLFLHQSFLKSPFPVKLTWQKMQKFIFYLWKKNIESGQRIRHIFLYILFTIQRLLLICQKSFLLAVYLLINLLKIIIIIMSIIRITLLKSLPRLASWNLGKIFDWLLSTYL